MIVNTRDSVIGVVKENEDRLRFSGVETETAKVSVDNTSKEIKVDVLVKNIIGTDTDKAYPGVRGLAQEEILTAEIERAKKSEKELETSLTYADAILQKNIDAHVAAVDSRFVEIQKFVDHELDELDTSLSLLESKTKKSLSALAAEMKQSDASLSDDIDTLGDKVSSEIKQLQNDKSDKDHTHELSDILDYASSISEFDASIKQHVASNYVTKETFESDLSSLSEYSEETYSTKKDVSDKLDVVHEALNSISGLTVKTFNQITDELLRLDSNVLTSAAEIDTLQDTVDTLTSSKSDTTHNHNIENLEGYASLFDKFVTHIPSQYITEEELNKALDDSIGNIDFSDFVEKDNLTSLFLSKVNSIGGCTSADFKV